MVDDESVIASTLAMILNASGYRAMSFTSAAEAIAAAELNCPDLLLTDVSMPGMNGIELGKFVQDSLPKLQKFFSSLVL